MKGTGLHPLHQEQKRNHQQCAGQPSERLAADLRKLQDQGFPVQRLLFFGLVHRLVEVPDDHSRHKNGQQADPSAIAVPCHPDGKTQRPQPHQPIGKQVKTKDQSDLHSHHQRKLNDLPFQFRYGTQFLLAHTLPSFRLFFTSIIA